VLEISRLVLAPGEPELMRFEKRELKPYAEPVSVEKLKNGQKLA
jgi:hypothetical protein